MQRAQADENERAANLQLVADALVRELVRLQSQLQRLQEAVEEQAGDDRAAASSSLRQVFVRLQVRKRNEFRSALVAPSWPRAGPFVGCVCRISGYSNDLWRSSGRIGFAPRPPSHVGTFAEREEAMEAKLIVVGGKANRSEVKLKLPAMLGRGRDVDVTVAHATVSRHHCLLYELDGALVVRDNGSLNGTLVDGRRVKEAVVRPGQSLTIGPLTFRAEYQHNGSFPRLGSPDSDRADSKGDLSTERPVVDTSVPSKRAEKPAPSKPSAAPAKEPLPKKAARKSESDNFGLLDDEPAVEPAHAPGFEFLDEEESADQQSPAGAFNFLDDEPSSSEDAAKPKAAEQDSEEVFRFADEPQVNNKKEDKAKPRGKAAAAKRDEDAHVGVSAGDAAKSGKGNDPALDDFLNSLGLED